MATFADLELAIEDLPDEEYRVSVDTTKCVSDAAVTPELAKLYAKWGMLSVEVKEDVWPRPKELDVLPAWRFAYGFRVLLPTEYENGSLIRSYGFGLIEANGDPIDQILVCISDLKDGIGRLRKESLDANALMVEGRKDWNAASVGNVLDNLKKRPAAELAPHVNELCDALLTGGRFTMGVLDVLAAAGPEAFRTVAPKVYAHGKPREYVIQLLGSVRDTSPEAIAMYREAFEGDEQDEIDKAFEAVKLVAKTPGARELTPVLRSCVDTWEDDNKAEAIALLGFLGEDAASLVDEHLESLGESFSTLLAALRGLDVSRLGPKLLAQYHTLDPKDRNTLEVSEGLVALGFEDREAMSAALREHFVPRGGRWTSRAEAVLSRWK